MMKEISLHVLDIIQNSIAAQATLIEIEVEVRREKDWMRVSIKDNGCGMDEEFLKKVVSPFTTSRKTRKVGLGIPMFKIPSGEITNLPFIRHIAGKQKPVILSTGMATMEEIEAAISILISGGLKKEDITVLHCNTEYPTPMEDVNLKAMLTIKSELGVRVGYSDHTLGIEVPIAATALGAEVIEKHFTLDRNMPGPDHRSSLEPAELKAMVKAIRNIELAVAGTGVKEPSQSERNNMIAARKSIVASKPIRKGEKFSEENLSVKRPGIGLSPMLWDKVLGNVAIRDFEIDELIII
jgi:N,N'-diacetyllegionaminate synthase